MKKFLYLKKKGVKFLSLRLEATLLYVKGKAKNGLSGIKQTKQINKNKTKRYLVVFVLL